MKKPFVNIDQDFFNEDVVVKTSLLLNALDSWAIKNHCAPNHSIVIDELDNFTLVIHSTKNKRVNFTLTYKGENRDIKEYIQYIENELNK